VSLYLNPGVLDLENFQKIGAQASSNLIRGYSSTSKNNKNQMKTRRLMKDIPKDGSSK